MVIDATNGKIIDKITIGDGCDGVAFDAAQKNIYTSNGADGNLSVIHESSANKFEFIENIPTKKGARTIACDNATHLVYVPTADFEPQDPAQEGRPKMIPGSFQVLVVGK
jgi:DNA-binding beta-propeller fold protein YncE